MAFLNRSRSMLSQNISQSSASSMMKTIRCLSSGSSIFVAGLSYGINNGTLKEAFSYFGEVVNAKVILDRESGKSRGFGFVEFADSDSANDALAMDGQDVQGRAIHVSLTNKKGGGPSGGHGGGVRRRN